MVARPCGVGACRPTGSGSNARTLPWPPPINTVRSRCLPIADLYNSRRNKHPAQKRYQSYPTKTEVIQRKDVESSRVKGGFIIFCKYEATIMTSPAISSQNGKGDSPSAVNSPSKLSAASAGGSSWTAWWRIFKLANLLMQQGC